MMRYEVIHGLSYPTNPDLDAQLRAVGARALEAAELAESTGSEADRAIGVERERERNAAILAAVASGALKTAEPGETVDDLPPLSIPWLLANGHIRLIDDPAPRRRARRSADDEGDRVNGEVR